ncbi:MAG TPA: YqaA family protein [Alphaproteobacteria bacterium]
MELAGYGGLFLAAFLAATILPSSSEIVLVGLLAIGDYSPWLLVAVASIGNLLGAIMNYYIGRGIERFRDKKWFPGNETSLARAQSWFNHYGKWSLLLSWVPMIGDALTLVAGLMRVPLPLFMLLVGSAKTMRYIVVTIITLYFTT